MAERKSKRMRSAAADLISTRSTKDEPVGTINTEQAKAHILSLPLEIREMVYSRAAETYFSGTFIEPPGSRKRDKWSGFFGLLASCKKLHAEFRPFFFHATHRIVISKSIDAALHTVNLSIDPHILQHIHIDTDKLRGVNAEKVLGSMKNLRSMVYFGSKCALYTIPELIDEDEICRDCLGVPSAGPDPGRIYNHPDSCELCGGLGDFGLYNEIAEHLYDAVSNNTRLLTRRCRGGHRSTTVCRGCAGDDPIRRVARVWNKLGRPFQLISDVRMTGEYEWKTSTMTCRVNLGTGDMKIFGQGEVYGWEYDYNIEILEFKEEQPER